MRAVIATRIRAVVAALLLAFARAGAQVSFGIADFEEPPGGGWILMRSSDFERLKQEFVAHYNANQGIAPLSSFTSGNCCFAVEGGNKLIISNT